MPSWPTTSVCPSPSSPPSTARRPGSASPCPATATSASPPPGPSSPPPTGSSGCPCAFGLAWLLPKLIGLPRALDLILSSRTFAAEEALDLGLVTAVVPVDQLAEPRRRVRPDAGHLGLAGVHGGIETPGLRGLPQTAAEAVRVAEALLDPMMAGPDYREGVAALREKRPAVYGDLPSPIPRTGPGAQGRRPSGRLGGPDPDVRATERLLDHGVPRVPSTLAGDRRCQAVAR